jgi:hypothetical protein
MKIPGVLAALLISSSALACPPSPDSLYAPKIPFYDHKQELEPDFDVATINAALDRVEAYYQDYLRPAGVEFSINRMWTNNYKNAHPRRVGNQWIIDLYGGTFDRKQVTYSTVDWATVLACHEIGHHLGGTHFYPGEWSWAAGEGQSDYFSTLKCMRRILGEDDNVAYMTQFEANLGEDAKMRAELAVAKETCGKAWSDPQDQALCTRSALSGVMFSINFDGKSVSLATPDANRTSSTYYYHPDYQCRVDTFLSGARCTVDERIENDMTDPKVGNCEQSDELGKRPACWFADASEVETLGL